MLAHGMLSVMGPAALGRSLVHRWAGRSRSPTIKQYGRAALHGCSSPMGGCVKSAPLSIRNRRKALHVARGADSTEKVGVVATETTGEVFAPAPGTGSAWRWEKSEDAAWAYGIWALIISVGAIPAVAGADGVDMYYFLSLAMATIYIGAHRNMTAKTQQSLSLKEGFIAPLVASAVLFGGYLLFKFFPDLNIQTFLNVYFGLLGTIAVSSNLKWPLRRWLGRDSALSTEGLVLPLPDGLLIDMDGSSIPELRASPSDALALLLAVTLTYQDIQHGHMLYPVNNAIATMIVADLLGLLGLNSFKTGAVLLIGLLLYDVFWVFGSPKVVGDNVMLAMATSNQLTGPIKLLFPRPELDVFSEAGNYPFELLGLGDVALPGLLACLALRYDASRTIDIKGRAIACAQALQDAMEGLSKDATGDEIVDAAADAVDIAYDEACDKAEKRKLEGGGDVPEEVSEAVMGNRNFFFPVLAAYGLGLYIAFEANRISHLGQPALLYLVPCTLSAVAATAAVRSEVKRVWQFQDNRSGLGLKELWESPKDLDDKSETP